LAAAKRKLSDAIRCADLEAIVVATNEINKLAPGLEVALQYYPTLFPA
jgi:hypothetical protein